MIPDRLPTDQCIVVNYIYVLQASINVMLTDMQKMTQEKNTEIGGKWGHVRVHCIVIDAICCWGGGGCTSSRNITKMVKSLLYN